MVVDSGTQHQLHAPTRTCDGCGQPWPCYVALLHHDPDAESDPTPAAPLIAIAAVGLVLVAAMVWLAVVVAGWWLT